ncbi:hypothetical protein GT002_40825, partial [Streptomyces sp. SID4917]|nr:hypothetical protein [Streptomyces sp. SID4917]
PTATAVDGLLHMQHNRLVGIGPEQEALSHAVLRGIAREHAGRLRHR